MTRRVTRRTAEVDPAAAETLQWWVPGIPRPKGSLTPVDTARGHLVGSDASVRWQGTQAGQMVDSVATVTRRPGRPVQIDEMRPGYPLQCPVLVAVEYVFPRRANTVASDDWPVGSDEPDVDKLLRNTLDALTVARVIADDGLVIMASGLKRYADGTTVPGAWITVTPAPILPVTQPGGWVQSVRSTFGRVIGMINGWGAPGA